jgi:hypothetical protein
MAGGVGKDETVDARLRDRLQVGSEQAGGEPRDRDGADRGRGLRFLAEPLAAVQPHELLSHSHLPAADVDTAAAQTDQFAPPHARIDGHVDHRPVALGVRLGQVDGLLPREEHLSRLGTRGGATLSHGLARILCFSTATCSTRRSVR